MAKGMDRSNNNVKYVWGSERANLSKEMLVSETAR